MTQLTKQDKQFEKTMLEINKPYEGMVETEKECEERKAKTPICPIMSWRIPANPDQHWEIICYKEECAMWREGRKQCGLIQLDKKKGVD